MFKKSVTFTDFHGNKKTEALRFNFTETEVLNKTGENEIFDPAFLQFVLTEGNDFLTFRTIQELILEAYGVLDEDGVHFRKSEQLKADFENSLAYDALIQDLIGTEDEKNIREFIANVFPKKYATRILKEANNTPVAAG